MVRKQKIIVMGPYGPVGAPRAADSGRLPSNSISASANRNRANEVVATATDSTTRNSVAAASTAVPIERPQASGTSSSIAHARPIAQQLQVRANSAIPMQSYPRNGYIKHGNFTFGVEQAILERLRGIAPFVIVQISQADPPFKFVIETSPQLLPEGIPINSSPSAQLLRELQSRVYTVFDDPGDHLPIRVRFDGNIFKLDLTGSNPAVPQALIVQRDQSSQLVAVNGGGGGVGQRVPTVAILQRHGLAASSTVTGTLAAATATVTTPSAGAQVAPTKRSRKQNLKLLASPKASTPAEPSEEQRESARPGPSKPAAKRPAGNEALHKAIGPKRAKQAKVLLASAPTLASSPSGGSSLSLSVQVVPNKQIPKATTSSRAVVADKLQRGDSPASDQENTPIAELPEPMSTLRGRKVKPTAKAVAAARMSQLKRERRIQYEAKRNASASPTSSVANADAQLAAQQPVDPANVEYCWKCHLPGIELLHCSRCSLGWHNKRHGCSNLVLKTKIKTMFMIPSAMTLPATRQMYEEKQQWVKELASVTDHTVCIECARKEAGTIYNSEFGFLANIDVNDQNYQEDMERCAAMYYYAVKSLMIESRKVQNAATGMMEDVNVFASLVHIDYGEHEVPEPIDLNWIYEKTRRIDAYLCTEDFMLDIKKLCHSYLILQQKKGIMPGSAEYKSAQAMVKELLCSADYDLKLIERCDSCYRQSFEVNTDRVKSDMVMPCEHSHAVVWMVHRNLWWPAKVYEYRQSECYFVSENYLYVVPFGDEKAGKRTTFQALRTFSRDAPPTTDEMAAAFAKIKPDTQKKYRDEQEQGMADAQQYYRKYWNEYFKKAYPVPKKAKEFTSNDLYVKNEGLKKGKRTLDANFKLSNRDGADDDDDDEGDNELAPVVKRGQMSKKPKAAAVPSKRASTSRAVAVEAAAGPSNAVRGTNSGAEQSVNKEMPLRRSARQTRK